VNSFHGVIASAFSVDDISCSGAKIETVWVLVQNRSELGTFVQSGTSEGIDYFRRLLRHSDCFGLFWSVLLNNTLHIMIPVDRSRRYAVRTFVLGDLVHICTGAGASFVSVRTSFGFSQLDCFVRVLKKYTRPSFALCSVQSFVGFPAAGPPPGISGLGCIIPGGIIPMWCIPGGMPMGGCAEGGIPGGKPIGGIPPIIGG
jgi:hypothetical protein